MEKNKHGISVWVEPIPPGLNRSAITEWGVYRDTAGATYKRVVAFHKTKQAALKYANTLTPDNTRVVTFRDNGKIKQSPDNIVLIWHTAETK